MNEREPARLKGLIDRLLAARVRRDRERRFSDAWRAEDTEMRAIEQAVFRLPLDQHPTRGRQAG